MKKTIIARCLYVVLSVLLSFSFLYLFSMSSSSLYSGGDCCASCGNYCHCDANCGTSCTAYECEGRPDECPGVGTRCCLCDDGLPI